MENISNLGVLDKLYTLNKIIGNGGTSIVYLSHLPENPENPVAIKVLKTPEDGEKFLNAEYDTLKNLNNENIVKIYGTGKGNIVKEDKVKLDLSYMILEYAENGDLFDYVSVGDKTGFGEYYGRNVFKSILNAVNACHLAGYCHRDIKLENVMVDKNYNLKLSDFGFACPLQGKKNNFLLSTPCGTPMYKAPELLNGKNYSGIQADVFSLGVTLFALVTGKAPFKKASRSEINYRFLINKNYKRFWDKKVSSGAFNEGLSPEFKDLFERMVAYIPNERPTIEQILNHPFFSLQTATKDETVLELKDRNSKREKDEVNFSHIENCNNTEVYRGENEENYFDENIKPYNDEYMLKRENCVIIKGDSNPSTMFSRFANLCEKEFESASVSYSSKKLKFTIVFNNEEEDNETEENEKEEEEQLEELSIKVRYNISPKENVSFINFQINSGDKFEYKSKLQLLKDLTKKL